MLNWLDRSLGLGSSVRPIELRTHRSHRSVDWPWAPRGRERPLQRMSLEMPPGIGRLHFGTGHWRDYFLPGRMSEVAESGYTRRSAIRQLARGAGQFQQRDARKLLWLCRRTSDPVRLCS